MQRRRTFGTLTFLAVLCLALITPLGAFAGSLDAGAGQQTALDPATFTNALYVGDGNDNTIKSFNATTGAYLGVFVPTTANVVGPRGMLFFARQFLVSNQNVNLPLNGEIDSFNPQTGAALPPVVPNSSPNAPFSPNGIIAGADGSTLYVVDFGATNIGTVSTWNAKTDTFLSDLDFSSFITSSASNGEFHPRGIVFGPDGLLYVTLSDAGPGTNLGWILSYNLTTGSVNVVASYNGSATDCSKFLHGPEGITFGPDGKLYVTSLRVNAGETDSIMIFNTTTGACVGSIALDQPAPQPVEMATGLVFGPGGHLFVPITGTGPATGAVRSYNIRTKAFTNFVLPSAKGGPLGSPWYLTFRSTNPSTLAFGG